MKKDAIMPLDNPASVQAALELLTPSTVINVAKIRVGNPTGDGGYVMLDLINAGEQAFSYGISDDATFEEDLADRGLTIAMFDHTINELPSKHERFLFVKQGLAGYASKDGQLAPLSQQLQHLPEANNMLLKVDIEGWEWNWLSKEDGSVLSRFKQIVMEMHGLEKLADPVWRQNFVSCLEKLSASHVLYHVHANNHRELVEIDGYKITPVLEVAFVHRSCVEIVDNTELYPHKLDFPNLGPRNDIVLDFFPFLPVSQSRDQLQRLVNEAKLNARPYMDRFAAFPEIPTRGENIAKLGRASQSSVSSWSISPEEASNAINGMRTGRPSFHTQLEDSPWWRLDFEKPEPIDEIIVFNRIDGEQQRAKSLILETTIDGANWEQAYTHDGSLFGGIDGTPLRISLSQRVQAIRLRINGRGYFHLDQVEVYRW
jgi:hypothetical protein